ncbi:glycoside hydrolase family 88/105 protein [Opitutus terrae]|uniref:Glycosyl hydrolase family 88 n=1 Tax=Opitutus terrae (strain DSM 11246 / JCM 15787 / PB90-1) TaxID=452637 RepID=B1ZV15_OPITP|nr:glycoside hydrolase family 88 protein [Opitutus terrae]ACB75985.1 glycosyl hydrolase family 88 [Opitutus terrae PB90-1]
MKTALAMLLVAGVVGSDCCAGEWPAGRSPEEIGRRVAENFLARDNMLMPPDQVIHYAQVCTWQGALTFADLSRDAALRERLIARYRALMVPANDALIPKREHVDWSVFGVLPLEIFLQTGDKQARSEGMWRADLQWSLPREDGLSRQTRFWIDDMYMIGALQTQAYRATEDPVYLERAARGMVVSLERLQQPNGLFFHGDEGRFHWGRGNGWMAAGMTELLRVLPKESRYHEAIMSGYRKMMAALLATQDGEGMWHQLVDDPNAWPESSCTGMFTFAMITGVKNGWLDESTYGPAARKGWLALTGTLDAEANVGEVCLGMGQKPTAQGYLDARRGAGDFHGQAPVLWCASAWLRPAGE